MLYRADRLLALILAGKTGAAAARELVQLLKELARSPLRARRSANQ